MWHTHILVSVTKYNADCLKIRGEQFHHDDSFDDRAPGSTLDVAFHTTCRVWRNAYRTNYEVPGAMYHGEPPSWYFNPSEWQQRRSPNTTAMMAERERYRTSISLLAKLEDLRRGDSCLFMGSISTSIESMLFILFYLSFSS